MRILVVGAGAVGGFFGADLMQAGRDVTFLVRPARAAALQHDGLMTAGPKGERVLQPRLVSAGAIDGPYDIVLISVKGFGLAAAMEDMAPAVGPNTSILPALNGMQHMPALIARFGEAAVIGGVIRIASQLEENGRIRQLASFQSMIYGERDGSDSARIRAVDAAMRDAGFDTKLSSNVTQDMWDKWVQLAALGAITCLFRGTIGAVAAVPHGAELAGAILDECVAVATACGQTPAADFVAAQRRTLTQSGSPMTSSMFRDLHAGATVEAEQIVGDLVARAEPSGTPVPLLRAAFVSLQVYQNALDARRA